MTVVLILSIKYQTLRSVPVRPTANLHDCQKPDFKSNVPIREIRSQYVLIVPYPIEAQADQYLTKYLSILQVVPTQDLLLERHSDFVLFPFLFSDVEKDGDCDDESDY